MIRLAILDKIFFEKETRRTVYQHIKWLKIHLQTATGPERETTLKILRLKNLSLDLLNKERK